MGQHAPLVMGKRKRTSQDDIEKIVKKEKVDAVASTIVKKEDMVSREYVLGRLGLIKKYMYEAWGGEMTVRSNLEKIRREVKGIEKKLTEE